MKETLEAVYEDGSPSLADCVNRISQEDAREMRTIIVREFEHVDLREWK